MTKIRKIVIGLMLVVYMAINNCDRSFYFTYHTTFHSIVLDYDPNKFYYDDQDSNLQTITPGQFVTQAANFYPGINMISINEYRFSLN